jgi:hypothetical protein
MKTLNKIYKFEKVKTNLQNIEIEKILNSFDKFSKRILKSKNFLGNKYRGYGLPFIAQWCKKENLTKILTNSFGSTETLNEIKQTSKLKNFKILPRGLVVHWVAGNVPTLGFLSLILGLITKNKNIVRLPLFSKKILEDLLNNFKNIDRTSREICKNILILRYDKIDVEISKKLSSISDARIIWGSDDTCKNIKSFETKLGCEDLVFSNRISFIIVDNKTLKQNSTEFFNKICRDILVFDQKACASPHTIFLEKASKKEISKFCKKLSNFLRQNYRRYQFAKVTSQKKMEILNLRLDYSLKHSVFSDHADINSTVLSDNKQNLGPCIQNGTIFVRKLPSIKLIKNNFPKNIQTLGITKNSKNLKIYISELQKIGLSRVRPIGQMTNFESIWDGINIPMKLTRFSTIYS